MDAVELLSGGLIRPLGWMTSIRVPTLLLTKKSRTFQDQHEKFSRTFSEPTNA